MPFLHMPFLLMNSLRHFQMPSRTTNNQLQTPFYRCNLHLHYRSQNIYAYPVIERFITLRVLCKNRKMLKHFVIIKRNGRNSKTHIARTASIEESYSSLHFIIIKQKTKITRLQKWCTNDGFSAFDIISFLAMLTYWRRG